MSKNQKSGVSKNTAKTAKRLLKYVTGMYKVQFVIVFVCILLSSVASISVSLSLKFLLDDFIIPLIGQKQPNFAELYQAMAVLGCIFQWDCFYFCVYKNDGNDWSGCVKASQR